MLELTIGSPVRIQESQHTSPMVHFAEDLTIVKDISVFFIRKVGILAKINEHNEDGDFYGVQFPESEAIYYFWRDEIVVLPKEGESEYECWNCHDQGCYQCMNARQLQE